MKRLRLVFSGEDVWVLTHTGLLKALDESGIQPSAISDTNGKALVRGLYACGVALEQMLDFFKETSVFKWSMPTFEKMGLVDNGKYTKLFRKYFKYPTFEDLRIPLSIMTTNLLTGKVKYFSEGELIQPLIASSALPPYFSPAKIGDGLYSGGGLLGSLPIEPIRKRCKVIIDSFVNSLEMITENELTNSFHSMQHIYSMVMNGNYSHKLKKCGHVFFHNLNNIGALDTKMLECAYQYECEQTNR